MLRFPGRFALIVLVTGAGMLAAGAFVFLQDTPRPEAMAPPAPEDVAATRQLVRNLRAAAAPDGDGVLITDAAQLNSAIRLGARFVDGFRGDVAVGADGVLGRAALPVPWPGGQKWLNITGRVPEFEGGFVLSEVTVGSVHLPPGLVLALARIGADLMIADRFAETVLQAATQMTREGEQLKFRIALDEMGKNGVMQGAFGRLRGAQMPERALIVDYEQQILAAAEDGRLSPDGSFLPWLRFAVAAALAQSTADTLANEYTAAVFGLARVCGAQDFAMIVGRLAFDDTGSTDPRAVICDAVTLNGRIDTRRHFITSAALQAASNTGVAVPVGEFKELYDTISGAGGFDFTDMAANLSGIRMSDYLMALPQDAWPAALARIRTEGDVIVPFEGVPGLMPGSDFKARFGDVDSPAYRRMIAEIEALLAGTGLYQVP